MPHLIELSPQIIEKYMQQGKRERALAFRRWLGGKKNQDSHSAVHPSSRPIIR